MEKHPKIIRGNLKEKIASKVLKVETQQRGKFVNFKQFITLKADRSSDDR